MQENLYYGEVIFFKNKPGFGFLSWNKNGQKQKDMFVHFSDINCDNFKTLLKGQKVSFNIGKNYHGVDKATNVTVM